MKVEKVMLPAERALHGLAPVQQGLAALAAGLDMRFVDAAATLATAVETIDRLIGAFDTILARLDDGAAVATLRGGAGRIEALPALQAERVNDIGAVRRATADLHADAMQVHELLRILRVNGTNLSMIASAAPEFAHFVEAMSARFDAGDAHLEAFMAGVRELAGGIAGVQRAARLLAAECGRAVPVLPGRLAEDACAVEAYQAAMVSSAADLGEIAREVQARVAVVLGALQIGDITRQRLEHMVAATQLVRAKMRGCEADCGPVAAHVARLIAAQLADLGRDFERETMRLLEALGELGPGTGRMLALMEDEAARGGRGLVRRFEQGIADVDCLAAQLPAARADADRIRDMVAVAMDALSLRLEGLRAVAADVQGIAARVQAAAAGNARGPAVAVAEEIAACAGRLGQAGDGVGRAIRALDTVSLSMRHGAEFEAQIEAGARIGGALARLRDGLRRTEQGIGESRIDARELADMLDAARRRLARELALGGAIAGFAAEMRMLGAATDDAPRDDRVLRALLEQIGGLYTMAREREVHRGFLLPGMAGDAAPAIAESALDDGLF